MQGQKFCYYKLRTILENSKGCDLEKTAEGNGICQCKPIKI